MSDGYRPTKIKAKDLFPKAAWRTYEEWFEYNRHVIKGEKSTRRNKKNQPIFSLGQTEHNDNIYNEDYDEDPFNDPYLFN